MCHFLLLDLDSFWPLMCPIQSHEGAIQHFILCGYLESSISICADSVFLPSNLLPQNQLIV